MYAVKYGQFKEIIHVLVMKKYYCYKIKLSNQLSYQIKINTAVKIHNVHVLKIVDNV